MTFLELKRCTMAGPDDVCLTSRLLRSRHCGVDSTGHWQLALSCDKAEVMLSADASPAAASPCVDGTGSPQAFFVSMFSENHGLEARRPVRGGVGHCGRHRPSSRQGSCACEVRAVGGG